MSLNESFMIYINKNAMQGKRLNICNNLILILNSLRQVKKKSQLLYVNISAIFIFSKLTEFKSKIDLFAK